MCRTGRKGTEKEKTEGAGRTEKELTGHVGGGNRINLQDGEGEDRRGNKMTGRGRVRTLDEGGGRIVTCCW